MAVACSLSTVAGYDRCGGKVSSTANFDPNGANDFFTNIHTTTVFHDS